MDESDHPPMAPIYADGEGRYEKDNQTYAIIGAAMEVHRLLGHGFLESVYQEALVLELADRSISYSREQELPIYYKGKILACGYRVDLVCYGEIVVELKAIGGLGPKEQAQVINYLKATGFSRGLLLNFGAPRLETKRFVRSPSSA